MWVGHAARLTADGEERVGLLARHRGHALQRVEASAAHVDPALHFRLAEAGAEERDGDDVELLLGGVHLLRAPDSGRRFAPLARKKPGGDHKSVHQTVPLSQSLPSRYLEECRLQVHAHAFAPCAL